MTDNLGFEASDSEDNPTDTSFSQFSQCSDEGFPAIDTLMLNPYRYSLNYYLK